MRSICARTSSGAPAGVNTLTVYQGGASPLQKVRLVPVGGGTNPPGWDPPRFGACDQPRLVSPRSKNAGTAPAGAGAALTGASAPRWLFLLRRGVPTRRGRAG